MVYQISGITRRINREWTSGRTIRKLPSTNRGGLGVLDNPHLPLLLLAKQDGPEAKQSS